MKKILLLAATLLLLTACGSDKSTISEETEKIVDVDKGLLDVEITLPAYFFEGESAEEIGSIANQDGVKEVKVNADGSVTYSMSKSKHKEMMQEMEQGVLETIDDLVNGEDFQSFKEISYNKDLTEFDVTVNKEAYENSFDGFALMGLALVSMYYSAFDGKTGDNITSTMNIIDEATGEELDSIVFPDAFDELGEEESNSETNSSN